MYCIIQTVNYICTIINCTAKIRITMKATTIQLTKTAIGAVKKSLVAKNRLQFELGKSYQTIQRWLADNDINLTTAQALMIISESTGIPQDDLLERAEQLV